LAADTTKRNDLVMIQHLPGWTPDQGEGDMLTALVNIKTGQMIRVPYRGAAFMPMSYCFSRDRTKVYASGNVSSENGSALVEIDLLSGDERRLTSPAIAGNWMGPVLSPDGKTLASLNYTGENRENVRASQIYLTDVATGQSRPIGKPLDAAILSWLPDGSGLVFMIRKSSDPTKASVDTIARMDSSGAVTPIRAGSWPVVLSPYERIVFLDEAQKRWKICDLAGKDLAVIGNGLGDFHFPTASPEGKQLIMMGYDSKGGLRPYLVDIARGTTTALPVEEGLWSAPAWR
jgi:Tol biopolymer transport system component